MGIPVAGSLRFLRTLYEGVEHANTIDRPARYRSRMGETVSRVDAHTGQEELMRVVPEIKPTVERHWCPKCNTERGWDVYVGYRKCRSCELTVGIGVF